jgi:hypothetical protein
MLATVLVSVLLPFFAAVDPKTEPLPTPMMRIVEPATVRPGGEVTVTGEHLGKRIVGEVYLSSNGVNTKVEVLTQTDQEIRFRVPADQKPGSYRIVVLMKSADPLLIEEPVRLIVQE